MVYNGLVILGRFVPISNNLDGPILHHHFKPFALLLFQASNNHAQSCLQSLSIEIGYMQLNYNVVFRQNKKERKKKPRRDIMEHAKVSHHAIHEQWITPNLHCFVAAYVYEGRKN